MNIECLARLNPKIQSLGDAGGRSEFTALDLAAACAGADDLGFRILLAKICGDSSQHSELFSKIYQIIAKKAVSEGWRLNKTGGRLKSLAQIALFESVNDFACPACTGTGFNRKRPTDHCRPCAGLGRLRLTDSIRAQVLGVSRSAWSELWNQRYRETQQIISDRESSAVNKISRQIGNRTD